jgi:hypothetical protein
MQPEQPDFQQRCQKHMLEKSPQQMFLANTCISTCRRLKLEPFPHPVQTQFKMIKDFTVSPKSETAWRLKALETLEQDSNHLEIRARIDQWDYITLKRVLISKETINRIKEWEKIFAIRQEIDNQNIKTAQN